MTLPRDDTAGGGPAAHEEMFMSLLAASLRGGAIGLSDPPGEEEWRKILDLARQQKVTGLIYDAAGKLPEEVFPAAVRTVFRREAMSVCISQTGRTERFLACLSDMTAAGFHPLVVKGLVLRLLYPKPDLRPSADEDLLVRREEYAGIAAWLLENGFSYAGEEPLAAIPQEAGLIREKDGLYVEIHTQLFSDDSELGAGMNRYFRDIFDHTTIDVYHGVTYETAEETRHLLYLFCHYIRHFLAGGAGIRQLCDIMLFTEKKEEKIDWHALRKWLREAGFDLFCGNLMGICRIWLGFQCRSWDRVFGEDGEREELLPLLRDILDAGVYGTSTMERRRSGALTMAAAERRNGALRSGIRKALFPSASYMRRQYPVLRERPRLLPAAYVGRMVSYLGKRRRHPGERSGLAIGRERIGLIARYGLMGRKNAARSMIRADKKQGEEPLRSVETRVYIDMLLTVIDEGRSVSLVITGGSMTPFLADGRDRVVLRKPDRPIAVGDIVLFRRQNGDYVLHRVRKASRGNYYMVGDAQTFIEGPVSRRQIAAIAAAAVRKGKIIRKGDLCWDFFETVWIRMVPLRPFFLRCYGLWRRFVR